MSKFLNIFNTYKNDQRLPLFLTFFIGLLIILYGYNVYRNMTSIIITPTPTTQLSQTHTMQDISQLHLFGKYDSNLDNLPQTQLQLTLEGIMLAPGNKEASYALISAPNTPTKPYKVGDTLPGDATIEKILKDRIVLNYEGDLQSLLLPIPKLTPTNDGND